MEPSAGTTAGPGGPVDPPTSATTAAEVSSSGPGEGTETGLATGSESSTGVPSVCTPELEEAYLDCRAAAGTEAASQDCIDLDCYPAMPICGCIRCTGSAYAAALEACGTDFPPCGDDFQEYDCMIRCGVEHRSCLMEAASSGCTQEQQDACRQVEQACDEACLRP